VVTLGFASLGDTLFLASRDGGTEQLLGPCWSSHDLSVYSCVHRQFSVTPGVSGLTCSLSSQNNCIFLFTAEGSGHSYYLCHQYQPVTSVLWTSVSLPAELIH
jgi:hypothetical protein